MKLLAFILSASVCLAAATKELSAFDANAYTNMQQNDAARAYNSTVAEAFTEHIELAASAEFNKQTYVEGELIKLNIKAKSSSKTEFKLDIQLGKNADMQLLKMEPISFANGVYSTTAYLKSLSPNATLTSIDLALFRASSQIASAKLSLKPISISTLAHNKNFSKVVADDLEFNNFKCTPYDEDSIICSADLKASNGAISSFALKDALSTSISANNRNYENNQAFIAMILPKATKSISFSYYKPSTAEFVQISKTITVASEDLSTQDELAPTSKELNSSLQIISLVLAIICFVLVLYFKRFFGLIALGIIFAAFGLVSFTSSTSATLAANSLVKILPTDQATVFARNKSAMKVKVLGEYKNYKKIQLSDEKVGWVDKHSLN